MKQLNTSQNYFNGMPSNELSVIPVPNKVFGDIVSVHFEHPEYKLLTKYAITELILEDDNTTFIDNHGLPINAVLEILLFEYKNNEYILSQTKCIKKLSKPMICKVILVG